MKKSSDETVELILFTVSDRTFAVKTDYLLEVLETIDVTPLPFVPDYVDGLINVNGQIIPQVEVSQLVLGEPQSTANQQLETLLIVSVKGLPISLRAGQILEPVVIDAAEIKPAKKDKKKKSTKTVESKYLEGIFVHKNNEVWVLSIDAFSDVIKAGKKAAGKPGFLGEVKETVFEDEVFIEYLALKVAGKEYLIELDDVYELIDLEMISRQPRAPESVVGITLVRGEPRLILDLAAVLGVGKCEEDTDTIKSVIMVRTEDVFCGLLIDELIGLEEIAKDKIKQDQEKSVRTAIRNDGETLSKILSPDDLFNDELLNSIYAYMPDFKQAQEELKIKYLEFLRFEVEGDAYGVDINEIKRVVPNKPVEPLLNKHEYIIGTLEIEGQVIPVVDLIKQLGYPGVSSVEGNEYLVVNDGKNDWGLAIHGTDQIIQVEETKIDSIEEGNVQYVSAFGNYNEGLLTILNPKLICDENHTLVNDEH